MVGTRQGSAEAPASSIGAPASLLPGPATAAECVLWAEGDVQALRVNGLRHFDVDYSARLLSALSGGVALRTDYSGAGTAEEAIRRLVIAVDSLGLGPQLDRSKFAMLRACDTDKSCRTILESHQAFTAPQCVQVDIKARAPADVMKEIKAAQARMLAMARNKAARQKTTAGKTLVIQKIGKQFVRKAMSIMMDGRVKNAGCRGYCTQHKRECKALRPAPGCIRFVFSVAGA